METRHSGHSARKQRRKQRVWKPKTTAGTLAWEGRCGCHGLVGRECCRRVPAQCQEMGETATAMDRVSAVSSRGCLWVYSSRSTSSLAAGVQDRRIADWLM